MGDPLVWRGDGPMAAWLERTADLPVGPQPDGYQVRGDIHRPGQPYGRITHRGLGPAGTPAGRVPLSTALH